VNFFGVVGMLAEGAGRIGIKGGASGADCRKTTRRCHFYPAIFVSNCVCASGMSSDQPVVPLCSVEGGSR
jgi:hypothetical protein